MDRRTFFSLTALPVSGILLSKRLVAQQQREKPPPINLEIVREFVRVAHSDLARVKELLTAHPLLLNSAWDWGGGDFETALGAAGHMGLKETANYLLDHGARSDIFVLTMLEKTGIVKTILQDFSAMLNAAGPHGLTLLHHAEKGGKEAEELHAFFKSKGLTEKFRKLF